MVRAPCCEKMGLKKGPWTGEEDQILIAYIRSFGHGNWRALPKKAGLLRCGKSCRLRWTNYLRPDIKRGNFSKEEEEAIIKLHEALGNRWSAIAAKLPGRTDNEIKNVWHTHLKKRVNSNEMVKQPKSKTRAKISKKETASSSSSSSPSSSSSSSAVSPSRSYSDLSTSVITEDNNNSSIKDHDQWLTSSIDQLPEIDESFWSEVVMPMDVPLDDQPFKSFNSSDNHEGMDFWLRVFMEAEELQELPEN